MSLTDLSSIFLAICLLIGMLLLSLKKRISLKDLERAHWRLVPKSEEGPGWVDAEILLSDELILQYRHPTFGNSNIGETIKVTSKSRRGKILIYFDARTGNVQDASIPGVRRKPINNQWAYDLRVAVQKTLSKNI